MEISDIYLHGVTSIHPGVTRKGANAKHGISVLWFIDRTFAGNPLTSAAGFKVNEYGRDEIRLRPVRVRPVPVAVRLCR